MGRIAVGVLVAVAGAAAAAPAVPATALAARTDAEAIENVAVDGGYRVAWPQHGAVTVLDDRSGFRTTFSAGRPCGSLVVLDGVAARFLVSCDGQLLVLDARDGTVTDVAVAGGDSYTRIGRHWLRGTHQGAAGTTPAHTNWHTGETRYGRALFGEPQPPFDLDAARLRRLGPKRVSFVTGQSRVLAEVGSGRRRGLELVERGRGRRIDRCGDRCNPRSVKGGLALWTKRLGRVDGYALRARRRMSWRVPQTSGVQGSTTRRVYYLVPSPGGPPFSDLRSFRWRR